MAAARFSIQTARLETKHLTEVEIASDRLPVVEGRTLDEFLKSLVFSIASVAERQGFVPGNVLYRFLSMISGRYTTLNVPVPSLQGDTNEKDLKPERGDWIVYRALLRLAALAPGALRSSSQEARVRGQRRARAQAHRAMAAPHRA